MSLSSIKSKETKGKQKVLPKLKTILANPNKTICPVLNEDEMEHLKLIFQKAINESDLQPRKYATAKAISLGLESSLRNINNKKSSCVFISLSIKPSHSVSLIARNAKIMDESQPVFAQPKLENFIEQLFGIKALCMVLPNDLLNISKELDEWVEKRKKPKRINAVTSNTSAYRIVKKEVSKLKTQKQGQKIESEEGEKYKKGNLAKRSSGGSFGTSNLSDDQVVDALEKIIDKVPIASIKTAEVAANEPMEVDLEQDAPVIQHKGNLDQEDSDYSDDFLSVSEYQPLTVHKIKGNPNKNPKKKKKKKKSTK